MTSVPDENDWAKSEEPYQRLINDKSSDSEYLREAGLKPNVLMLAAHQKGESVLDVGCGDGWLFDALQPTQGWECDITCSVPNGRRWPFSRQDVASLDYPDSSFDLTIASMLLMWAPDLHLACAQLHRVTRPGGRLVVALTHPSFYRRGSVRPDGSVLIATKYSDETANNDHRIANEVGPLRYFHRTVSTYVNTLLETGWRLRRLEEWSMDEVDYKARFPLPLAGRPRRTALMPLYLFLLLDKA